MEKKIEDYLHLYIGCDVWPYKNELYPSATLRSYTLTIKNINGAIEGKDALILRPLSDMTKIEIIHLLSMSTGTTVFTVNNHNTHKFNFEQFSYLLKQGFDLFGLIESGLAIDKTHV